MNLAKKSAVAILYAIPNGQTETQGLKESVGLIESVNGNLLGIVLDDQENATQAQYYYK